MQSKDSDLEFSENLAVLRGRIPPTHASHESPKSDPVPHLIPGLKTLSKIPCNSSLLDKSDLQLFNGIIN